MQRLLRFRYFMDAARSFGIETFNLCQVISEKLGWNDTYQRCQPYWYASREREAGLGEVEDIRGIRNKG